MAKRTGHRRGRASSLRRRVAFRTPKRTFLVFCEGTRTEPDYIKALKREPAVRESASVDIRIDLEASGAVPLTLVNAAAEARARSSREQDEIDQVWCLVIGYRVGTSGNRGSAGRDVEGGGGWRRGCTELHRCR